MNLCLFVGSASSLDKCCVRVVMIHIAKPWPVYRCDHTSTDSQCYCYHADRRFAQNVSSWSQHMLCTHLAVSDTSQLNLCLSLEVGVAFASARSADPVSS